MRVLLVSLAAATSLVAAVPLANGVTQQLVTNNMIAAPLSDGCDKFRETTLKFCYDGCPDDVVEDISKCFATIMNSEMSTQCTNAEKQTVLARLSADLSCVDDFARVCSSRCKAECTCDLTGADVAKCGSSRAKCSDCLLTCVGANEAELTRVQCSKENLIPFVEDMLSECPACQTRAVAYCQTRGPTVGECLEKEAATIVSMGLCTKDEIPNVKPGFCRDAADNDEMKASCSQCLDEACMKDCGKKLLVKAGCLTEELNFDTDNDGVTEDCEKYMETKCKPEAVAATYAQCLLDPTNQLTQECTMTELISFTKKYCKTRAELAMDSDKECKSVCDQKNEICRVCVLEFTDSAGCNLLPAADGKDVKVSTPIALITPLAPIAPVAPVVPDVGQPIPESIKPQPAVTPGDVDANNDQITDNCATKVMEICDPTKNADAYDTCVSAYACDFDGYCTSKELMKLFTTFCGMRQKVVDESCMKVCASSPGPDCNDCKDEAYLSAGCLNANRTAPVIEENANKLDGVCKLAKNAGVNAEYLAEKLEKANDNDMTNDMIGNGCAESVQAVCSPAAKSDTYDECIAANVCKFQGKCKQDELFRFTTQYCVTKLKFAQTTVCKGNTNIGCLRYELLKGGCRLYLNGKVGPAPTVELDIGKLDKTCATVQTVRDQINSSKPPAKPMGPVGPTGELPKVPEINGEPEPPKMVIDKVVDRVMEEQMVEAVTSKTGDGEPELVVPCKLSKNKQIDQIVETAKNVADQVLTEPAKVDISACLKAIAPQCEKSSDEDCMVTKSTNAGSACPPAAQNVIKHKYCKRAIAVGPKMQGKCRLCTCGTTMNENACPGGSAEACVKSVLAENGCGQEAQSFTPAARGINFRSGTTRH